jgi:NIPSNAP
MLTAIIRQEAQIMIYMQASIKLYPGKLPDFINLLNKLTPLVAKHGMKLVGSYASVVGRLNTVVDLWELSDMNALEALGADPELRKYREEISSIIEDEVLTMMTKLPIG